MKGEKFTVFLTLPKWQRPRLRKAAAGMDLPMSEFSRRAVLEALRKVKAGEPPFSEGRKG
jgi:hypothetical protein